jgi:hypothetical protein
VNTGLPVHAIGTHDLTAKRSLVHLRRSIRRTCQARRDHQVAAGCAGFRLNHLADRPDCVDDRRTGRVGHESGKRLQRTAARLGGEGEPSAKPFRPTQLFRPIR